MFDKCIIIKFLKSQFKFFVSIHYYGPTPGNRFFERFGCYKKKTLPPYRPL